jgi:surface antigen
MCITAISTRIILKPKYKIGEIIDMINGVCVYYNGSTGNVSGRNLAKDGYNLGQKYQCVEFVKRYYYEYFNHKMPNSYGDAKDFFDSSLKDGQKNKQRNLVQYRNPSKIKPNEGDILIFDGTVFNSYGHVAIISKVTSNEIEIIQQNNGSKSRETILITREDGKWTINNSRVLGFLRK